MTIQSEIANEDWNAYVQFIRHRISKNAFNQTKRLLMGVGFWVVLALLIYVGQPLIHPFSIIFGSLGMALWILAFSRLQSRGIKPSPDGIILGQCSITLDEEGLRTSAQNYESLYRWKTVRGAELTDKHIFVLVDCIAAITIPRRSFSSDSEQEQFLGEIQKHVCS